jgi:hypothetical protein
MSLALTSSPDSNPSAGRLNRVPVLDVIERMPGPPEMVERLAQGGSTDGLGQVAGVGVAALGGLVVVSCVSPAIPRRAKLAA